MELKLTKQIVITICILISVIVGASFYINFRIESKSKSLPSRYIVENYFKSAAKKFGIETLGYGGGTGYVFNLSGLCERKLTIPEARLLILENMELLRSIIRSVDQEALLAYYGENANEIAKKIRLVIYFIDKDKREGVSPTTTDDDYVVELGKVSAVALTKGEVEYMIYELENTGYYGFKIIHSETLEDAEEIVKEGSSKLQGS